MSKKPWKQAIWNWSMIFWAIAILFPVKCFTAGGSAGHWHADHQSGTEHQKLLPPNGVYLSRTRIGEQAYYGVTNIGYKPTIGETFRGVETVPV